MGLSERQTLMPKQLGLLGKFLRIPCALAAANRSSAPPFRLDGTCGTAAASLGPWSCGIDLVVSATSFRRRAPCRAAACLVWVFRASLRQRGGGLDIAIACSHFNRAQRYWPLRALPRPAATTRSCRIRTRTRTITARGLRALYQRAALGCEGANERCGAAPLPRPADILLESLKLTHSLNSGGHPAKTPISKQFWNCRHHGVRRARSGGRN